MAAPISRRTLVPVLGAVALLLFGATFAQQAQRLSARADRCSTSAHAATAHLIHGIDHHAMVERTIRHAEARLRDVSRARAARGDQHARVDVEVIIDEGRVDALMEQARLARERARLEREAAQLEREAARLERRMEALAEDEG